MAVKQTLTVAALYLFPVKSLGGIAVHSAKPTPLGFEHDRQWMLVNHQGRFMTQREVPRMCLIQTELIDAGVRLSVNGSGSFEVPFSAPPGQVIDTAVWGDECTTVDLGDEAAQWLGQALELRQLPRLVQMQAGFRRPQRRPERYGQETTTGFADGAPYLVANQSSLLALNQVLQRQGLEPVSMNRFRANIVVDGLPAFAEHQHERLKGPGYVLALKYPCERCSITTVDPNTGLVDSDRQPWKTLRDINPMPDKPMSPAFAENTVLLESDGSEVRVGDCLEAFMRPAQTCI